MRIEMLGDRAFVLRDLPSSPSWCARVLEGALGDVEVVPSYESIGVYALSNASLSDLEERLYALEWPHETGENGGKLHELPVCYELGPDLGEAAERLELSAEALVDAHAGSDYQCFALGFCPGFAYLGYLPEVIAGLPRKVSPRVRVEPGSVGITGRQTGVYPLERPGGWWLIGRCPLELVSLEDAYFPISAGDRVRFRRIDEEEFARRMGERL
ncbi:MAG TPA: carboxyltransferase domain-containing protein [Fimbriimonadaceae bacterium]|nr:carboxyltransferase domain-containing protein [Fimbriimonadaceae bacterium]